MSTATAGTADRVIGTDQTERLASLFDTHADRLYRLARRLVQTPDDAKDLVQETFTKAALALRPVPVGHADEEAWLVRVMLNIQRDIWRKAAVRKKTDALLVASRPDRPPSAESRLAVREAVWNALNTLSPRRRAIVVLREFEGIEVQQIARLLGIATMTARWHLSMARRELQTILKPFVEGHR